MDIKVEKYNGYTRHVYRAHSQRAHLWDPKFKRMLCGTPSGQFGWAYASLGWKICIKCKRIADEWPLEESHEANH